MVNTHGMMELTLMLLSENTPVTEAAVWGDRDTSALPDIPHKAVLQTDCIESSRSCIPLSGLRLLLQNVWIRAKRTQKWLWCEANAAIEARRTNWLRSNSQIRSLQCAIISGQYRIEKGSQYSKLWSNFQIFCKSRKSEKIANWLSRRYCTLALPPAVMQSALTLKDVHFENFLKFNNRWL